MRPTAKQLAMRDPALAALLGVLPGSDFGGNSDFGIDMADDELGALHSDVNFHGEYGVDFGDDWGGDYGGDYGVEFGAGPAIAARSGPSQSQTIALWKKHRAQVARTTKRGMLLEPNKGSNVKIERYAFAVNASLVLGTAAPITASGQPDTNIRPQRVTMNAPSPGFATIREIKVANVSVTVGGISDAFDYSSLGVGQTLDMPTLTPANRASVSGDYTGFVPPGFVGGSAYLFAASFKGPASIVA